MSLIYSLIDSILCFIAKHTHKKKLERWLIRQIMKVRDKY